MHLENKSGPKGIRERNLAPNKHGLLPSQAGKARPQGKSVTRTPEESGLQGHYHTLREDVKMPGGLGIKHDGRDMPGGYMSPGHSTVYPTRDMTPDEFNDSLIHYHGSMVVKYGRVNKKIYCY